MMGARVDDIRFKITQDGNLIPDLILTPPSQYSCPNLYTLQKVGVWIGDTVWISPKDRQVEVIRALRPIDATPAELPTHCPSCLRELSIRLDRRLVVKCLHLDCNARTRIPS